MNLTETQLQILINLTLKELQTVIKTETSITYKEILYDTLNDLENEYKDRFRRSLVSNFKIGDRVYLIGENRQGVIVSPELMTYTKKRIENARNRGISGSDEDIVEKLKEVFLRHFDPTNELVVETDSINGEYKTKIVRKTTDLVLEEIYNSPLYKTLMETEEIA